MNNRKYRFPAIALSLFSLVSINPAAAAATIGWVEEGLILPEGIPMKMKLDTGALTSSIDAHAIKRFERNGENWVRFTAELENPDTKTVMQKTFERPVIRRVELRGAGGIDHRITVKMRICVGTRSLDEQFTLNDRSRMNYPVLLGRRTLKHIGPIDVTKTFTVEPSCEFHR